jgi:hypothetical protein
MRKLVITAAASVAIGAIGVPLWQAHAANLGDGGIKFAIKNYTPITKAACWGWARIARRDARAFAGAGAAGVHFARAAKQSVVRLRRLQKKMAGKPGHQARTRPIETSLCIRLRMPICRRVQFDDRTHKYHRQPEQHRHVTPPR